MRLSESRRTITALLQDAAASDPDATAVSIIGGRSYTRSELIDASLRIGGAMTSAGVQVGDRVVIILGNKIEFLTSWCGAVLRGALPVPLHTSFVEDILANLLRSSAPCVIVAERDCFEKILPALNAAGFDGTLALVGDGSPIEHSGMTIVDFSEWDDHPVPTETHVASPADPCTIFYSSGTTGPSKGAIWPHNAVYSLAEAFATLGKYAKGDVVHTATPLFHALALANGFLASLMCNGSCLLAPRFSLSRFWQEIVDFKATKTMMLGEMVTLITQQEPTDLERQHQVTAAFIAPRPAKNFTEFEDRFGLKIFGAFGNTDVGLPLWAPQDTQHPSAVGQAVDTWEVMLVDEFDEEVPDGQAGELIARPRVPFVGTMGYWGMPEATIDLVRNCWYHTGDILRRSDDGWFYFVDRKKDSMRRGGENISSFEVEQALLTHPAVLEVAVFAVAAELAEDDVMACLVLRPGASLEEVGLHAEKRLPYFAVPRYYDVRESLPRTPTQKIMKAALRNDGVTPTTWDRGRVRRTATAQPIHAPSSN
jgi:carnitine-CoA ligase